ncbi:MAG TPA: glycosyltransferase family 2 protein [bacterium]|nr:glycosyltransferase family 2 protein [bacterium]HOL46821.1 glycosyltransferase family 2 protein [bacterium]HPQ18653.1 glycosyltransferase family 2 protein [bacterium]
MEIKNNEKLISIIIPVFNEEKTLNQIINKVEKVPLKKEIIVVDDGSTDNSRKIILELEKQGRIKAVFSEKNQGKGSAIKLGIKNASGDIMIIQDADLEYDPMEIPIVVEPIIKEETDVCYGSRILKKENNWSTIFFYIGGRFVSLITSILFFKKVTDEPTCYKAFKSSLVKNLELESNGFELEPELTAKLFRLGCRYKEVPISYYSRKPIEGKKLKGIDGLKAVWTLLKWRFLPIKK